MVAGKPRSPRTKDAAALGDTSNGLGARLRLSRERTGMTVRGMARAIGVSPSLVSQIERGRVMPSVGTLYAISTNWACWSTTCSAKRTSPPRRAASGVPPPRPCAVPFSATTHARRSGSRTGFAGSS
jgi:DNA-binding XRE family transcriptional regulator